MSGQRTCLSASLGRFVTSQRCFGHQRTKFVIGRFVSYDRQLLLELREFTSQIGQSRRSLGQTTLEKPAGHTRHATSR